jgi:hypothetical protein
MRDPPHRLFRLRRWLAALLFVTAAVACIGAMRAYFSTRQLVASAPAAAVLDHPAETGVPQLTDVRFAGSGGARLAAWYVPSRNGAAVVVAHGTNSDRSAMLPEVHLLANAGFGVLAFDWPGLGASPGVVRWDAGAKQALGAAVEFLARQPGVDPQRLAIRACARWSSRVRLPAMRSTSTFTTDASERSAACRQLGGCRGQGCRGCRTRR